jgi:hypothetical protein
MPVARVNSGTAKQKDRAMTHFSLSEIFSARLTPNIVRNRSHHTAQAIRKRAVVVLDVPEVKDRESDEQSHENSHFISDLQRASGSAR